MQGELHLYDCSFVFSLSAVTCLQWYYY